MCASVPHTTAVAHTAGLDSGPLADAARVDAGALAYFYALGARTDMDAGCTAVAGHVNSHSEWGIPDGRAHTASGHADAAAGVPNPAASHQRAGRSTAIVDTDPNLIESACHWIEQRTIPLDRPFCFWRNVCGILRSWRHSHVTRYSIDDTIVAISTPLGEGGIGIVRLSGPDSQTILQQLVEPVSAPGGRLAPRHLTLGYVRNPTTGRVVDEVLASYMPAPATYTRQDVVEINCHGGIVAIRSVLELCLAQGARLAGPGEFTLRAFVNGRVDLTQAEAILDVIRSRTAAGLQVAVGQLAGRLSGEVRAARQRILEVQAHVVASIDFPEDEIPSIDMVRTLDEVHSALTNLLNEADRGIVYRQGVRTALVGRPNVGKSSLLNALLRTNRAIVTPVPGTTRDTVEETLNLQGIPLVLVDTAGLTSMARDPVEQMGIARSHEALTQADLILVVLDGSVALQPADWEILSLIGERPALLIVNKSDLPSAVPVDEVPVKWRHVVVSAKTGAGLPQAEAMIVDMILGGEVQSGDDARVSNPRHKAALSRARNSVGAAIDLCHAAMPADFIGIDLADALDSLGEITGETADEELLDRIFSEFCIGK